MHPGEVQTGTALAAVPSNQQAGLESLADNPGHPTDLAQQQRELRIGHVIQDWAGVRTEDHPGVSGQHFDDERDDPCGGKQFCLTEL